MTDRLVVDIDTDGRVSVSTWLADEPGADPPSEPFPLAPPLADEALEDLRWYLEDYLRVPYGVYGERGARITAALPEWGAAMFGALFRAGPARDAYATLRATEQPFEIVFRSGSARWLGLPWELMRDPARPRPVALDGLTVTRGLPAAGPDDTFTVAGDRLRVLMVISRPGGTNDVGYQMVARPLLRRLAAVRGEVDLVVLRPPTLDRLHEVLTEANTAGEPFQIVHFDGHGVLAGRRAGVGSGPQDQDGHPAPQGILVFENPTGGAHRVPAAAVAQVLAEARVPVVVLNACQSGAVGKELEAAVATRLIREGVAVVVAMAYTVYAVAAAEFMAAFYERLFAGDRVADAVSAGRRRLARRSGRPSPKGRMPLADWIVPVHYARGDVRFPGLRTARTGAASLDERLDRPDAPAGATSDDPLDPVGEFVGRDALFHTLEGATRRERVVVLHGPGGTGKTELAKAYARWWRDTGGVDHPEWVVWHSFEPGLASFGLHGVVAAIGLRVLGTDFAGQSVDEQRRSVEQLLAAHRLLLVWDNFESVCAMPDPTGATPALGTDERDDLRRFLAVVAAGRSAVVITSRTEETWLGDAVRRVAVPGLTTAESSVYADLLLAANPAATARRAKPAFVELMESLDGNPLSMRLILPRLDSTEPEALLDALRGIGAPSGDEGVGRTASLTASIAYSYDHLSDDGRYLLVALSLFRGVVNVHALALMSGVPLFSMRFMAPLDTWRRVLKEAAGVGLITALGANLYLIHPALPSYLTARWRDEGAGWYESERRIAQRALVDAYAIVSAVLDRDVGTGKAARAFVEIGRQRRNLSALFGYALEERLWPQAHQIVQPLSAYWDTRGLHEEARGWVDRARRVLEEADGAPPPIDTPAGTLWLFLVSSQVNRDINNQRIDAAERACRQIESALAGATPSAQRSEWLAGTYHQLGQIAEARGQLGEAYGWEQRGLALVEEGDGVAASAVYHHLGILAQQLGRLDEAEEWYRRSLSIDERTDNRHGVGQSYQQLALVAHQRGRLDEAEEWCLRSLAIHEELGDRTGAARNFVRLGTICEARDEPDQAEVWYHRFLMIHEGLDDPRALASVYHGLGNVAGLRGRFDEAEDWYLRSLQLKRKIGNRSGVALTSAQLGILAVQRGQPYPALEWMVRCVALFEEFPHPATDPGPEYLVALTAVLGVPVLERCWLDVTGDALPEAVRARVVRKLRDEGDA